MVVDASGAGAALESMVFEMTQQSVDGRSPRSVALVKMPVDDPARPYRLHALCAEHADLWESR